MLCYLTAGTNDLEAAGRFYDHVLEPLGIVRAMADAVEIGYRSASAPAVGRRNRFYILKPYDKRPATFGNGVTIAFEAPDRAAVDRFHARAMAAGGTDEGKPGLRPFHAHFYAAYVRDLDGNKIAAICEQPE